MRSPLVVQDPEASRSDDTTATAKIFTLLFKRHLDVVSSCLGHANVSRAHVMGWSTSLFGDELATKFHVPIKLLDMNGSYVDAPFAPMHVPLRPHISADKGAGSGSIMLDGMLDDSHVCDQKQTFHTRRDKSHPLTSWRSNDTPSPVNSARGHTVGQTM